jgi:hypothetical protein
LLKKIEYIDGNTDKIIGAKSDRGFTKYRKFSKRKVQEPFLVNFVVVFQTRHGTVNVDITLVLSLWTPLFIK